MYECFPRCSSASLLVQQIIVELKHIGILDLRNFLFAKGLADKAVIHIKIVALGRLSEIGFQAHVAVKHKVYSCFACNVNVQTIHLVFGELSLLFSKSYKVVCIDVLAPSQWVCVRVRIPFVGTALHIYNFDHEFRHIILHHIETIEVQMKSIYAYEFTKVYGPLGYLDADNFSNKTKHGEIIEKACQQKRQRLAHEAYLKHFVNDLHQEIPLWAYVDLLTISDISFLYAISEHSLKEIIAKHFGLTMNQGPEILGQYMHSMTIIRNLCAHGSRIYNCLFEQKPSLNKKEQALLIHREDGTIDNAHFYGFFLIMRRLLPTNSFAEMKQALIDLTEKYSFVRMDYYGFRAG